MSRISPILTTPSEIGAAWAASIAHRPAAGTESAAAKPAMAPQKCRLHGHADR